MIVKYSEIKKKDVINVETGKILGKITDITFNEKSGKIVSVTVPGRKSCFLSCESQEIDFDCIIKFGDDAILYKKCKPCKEESQNPCTQMPLCHEMLSPCENERNICDDE